MSSIAARRANKRVCPLQPNGILSRGTHGILAQMPWPPHPRGQSASVSSNPLWASLENHIATPVSTAVTFAHSLPHPRPRAWL